MIDKKTLENSAKLSRLHLNEEEQALLLEQMKRIIGHFDKLQKVDTEGVNPLYKAVEMDNIWRKDQVVETVGAEKLIGKAPETQEGQIKVPQVVK